MRQYLNKLEIHRQTYLHIYIFTDRHLAICNLTTFWSVQNDQDSIQDRKDSHQDIQNNHQDSQDNQDSHQVSLEMEWSKQEMELFL